jgi:hypothetical protein
VTSGPRVRTLAVAAAGPALIVATVLVVLHDFAFLGMAPSQQNDVLGFWLPNHCFLGRSLAGGDIPLWNPHVLGGVPFAADPQSGWMYLPAMALYAALPCEAALPAFIVLQPLVAGLAMYWFLRSEELTRVAATVGGLALSLAISGSGMAVSLPVSASLAWSAVLLGLAARALRADAWASRLSWVTLAALAWGQLAAAHLSHGLVLGTATVIVYAVVRSMADVRAGRRTAGDALAVGALLLIAVVPVNMAYLLPRLSYVPRTTVGLGYDALREVAQRFSGAAPPAHLTHGGSSWPLKLATTPGAYLGGVPLLVSFVAWASRRHRPLTIAATLVAGGSYLLSLPDLARVVAPLARVLPFADVYLHEPSRFRFGLVLTIPILAATGLDAFRSGTSLRGRWIALVPAVAMWLVLPLLIGVDPPYLVPVWAGSVVGAALLAAWTRRPALGILIPVLLAVELAGGALVGQAAGRPIGTAPSSDQALWRLPFGNLLEPDVDPVAYLREGRIAESIRSGNGRYLTLQPWEENQAQGYVGPWQSVDGGLLDNQRAILFGLEDGQGYNPVQPLRFWFFSRRVNPAPPKYNVTVFPDPDPAVMDLLQVTWLVTGDGGQTGGSEPVAAEGPWSLYRGPARPRATLYGSWTVAPSAAAALSEVSSQSFDPGDTLVLETPPGVPAGAGGVAGTARYRQLGPEEAVVLVDAPTPAVLLVRNGFDPNWHATVDDDRVPILPGDYLLQAIPVPAGRHVVRLRYGDPTIAVGLAVSAIAVVTLLGAAAIAGRLARRRPREADDSGNRPVAAGVGVP